MAAVEQRKYFHLLTSNQHSLSTQHFDGTLYFVLVSSDIENYRNVKKSGAHTQLNCIKKLYEIGLLTRNIASQ